MLKRLLLTTILATSAALARAPAQAEASFADAPTVADGDLDDMRGGFLVADGIAFDLGAVVKTTVDGQLALETHLTWTAGGPVMEQMAGGGLNPATAAQLQAAAIKGLDLQGFDGKAVYLLNDGQTALVQQIGSNGLQNIVLNQADGQDIRQDTHINLSLPGFDNTQADMLRHLIGFRIGDEVQSGLSR